MSKTRALALVALLACASASAEFMSGNELLTRMSADNSYDRGVANGYIMGAFDSGAGITHCPPAGVTFGQVSDMVRQTLQAAPSVRHLAADSFVTYTLSNAWPCANKKQRGQNL